MTRLYFGTDGVRGRYGGPVVNEAFVSRLGAAAAAWMASRGVTDVRVLVGRDTRGSGPSLVRALCAGLASRGAHPVSLGVLPTPAVSRAVAARGASLGAVVTASHNPASDNGVKFFGPDGAKFGDDEEARIEGLLPERGPAPPHAEPPLEEALSDYRAAAARLLPSGALRGWRLVIDTANGATCMATPDVFRSLGAEIEPIGDRPDGTNINAGVGSEYPQTLAARVRASGARLGLAHDGDGDRCVLCDEQGGILDGDEILTILALDALARGALAGRTLVVTEQSNLGVDAVVATAGGRVLRTPVGDRYVAARMRAEGAVLGGESSGHIICFEIGPTGDGLAAALRVAGVMLATGKPLSELRRALRKFPQLAQALVVREKKPIESLAALNRAIRSLEAELGTAGRVFVRYSGTESKLRLLVEGRDEAGVREGMDRLVAAARSDLEVV